MTTSEYKKNIKKIITVLEEKKIVDSIVRGKYFHDDPKPFMYTTYFTFPKDLSDGRRNLELTGNGTSFKSGYEALFISLTETLERFSQSTYKEKHLLQSMYRNLPTKGFDISPYLSSEKLNKSPFFWIKGKDLYTNDSLYLPAQLIYLSYKFLDHEPFLTDMNSTGCAGGFTKEFALIRAIYEAIERDSYMCYYLTKLPPQKIDINSITYPYAQKMIKIAKRYNFEVHIFDVTTDIGIPTYMTIQVDRTGLGPCIGIGTKASLHEKEALIGSLKESFQTRVWLRRELLENSKKPDSIIPDDVNDISTRGRWWAPISKLTHLEYLFHLPEKKFLIKKKAYTNELTQLKNILYKKGIQTYFADISSPIFKKIPFYTIKTFIPDLQTLPLSEKRKRINHPRLQKFIQHLGYTRYSVNPLPQPFL